MSAGDFFIFHKCSSFWPLSIVILSCSEVVKYVTVRSSRTPSFNSIFAFISGGSHTMMRAGSGHSF